MNWTIFGAILAITLGAYFASGIYVQMKVKKMSELLYKDNNGEAYLKHLNDAACKIIFSKQLRTMMSIDAYIAIGDVETVENVFEQLKEFHLQPGDEFLVCQKKIGFYIEKGNDEKAEEAYSRLVELYDGFKDKMHYKKARKEVEYLVEIHLRKNASYLDEMLSLSESTKNKLLKGIYLFRAAKCYFYKNNNKKVKETLLLAKEYCVGTAYEKKIDVALSGDLSVLAKG